MSLTRIEKTASRIKSYMRKDGKIIKVDNYEFDIRALKKIAENELEEKLFSDIDSDFLVTPEFNGQSLVRVKAGNLLLGFIPGGIGSFIFFIDQLDFAHKTRHRILNIGHKPHSKMEFEDMLPFSLDAYYDGRTGMGLRDLVRMARGEPPKESKIAIFELATPVKYFISRMIMQLEVELTDEKRKEFAISFIKLFIGNPSIEAIMTKFVDDMTIIPSTKDEFAAKIASIFLLKFGSDPRHEIAKIFLELKGQLEGENKEKNFALLSNCRWACEYLEACVAKVDQADVELFFENRFLPSNFSEITTNSLQKLIRLQDKHPSAKSSQLLAYFDEEIANESRLDAQKTISQIGYEHKRSVEPIPNERPLIFREETASAESEPVTEENIRLINSAILAYKKRNESRVTRFIGMFVNQKKEPDHQAIAELDAILSLNNYRNVDLTPLLGCFTKNTFIRHSNPAYKVKNELLKQLDMQLDKSGSGQSLPRLIDNFIELYCQYCELNEADMSNPNHPALIAIKPILDLKYTDQFDPECFYMALLRCNKKYKPEPKQIYSNPSGAMYDASRAMLGAEGSIFDSVYNQTFGKTNIIKHGQKMKIFWWLCNNRMLENQKLQGVFELMLKASTEKLDQIDLILNLPGAYIHLQVIEKLLAMPQYMEAFFFLLKQEKYFYVTSDFHRIMSSQDLAITTSEILKEREENLKQREENFATLQKEVTRTLTSSKPRL